MSGFQRFPTFSRLSHWPDEIDSLSPGHYFVEVPVARLLSGQNLNLSIHIVRGQNGPVLGLLAGIHGDEIVGVRCIRSVLSTISADSLKGSIVAVPVANPLAWQSQSRATPERDIDHSNLARVFSNPNQSSSTPSASASVTRHIAATLEQTFFSSITHLIDYHCYGRETMVRVALYRTQQDKAVSITSRDMAQSFGLGVMYGVGGGQGTTSAYAAHLSIPACVLELGGTHTYRNSEESFVQQGAEGALRVMYSLGMLDTAPIGAERQLIVDRAVNISPSTSGYYISSIDLEDLADPSYPNGIPVRAGDVIGELYDPYTLESIEEVVVPEDGYLIALFRGGPYQVGGSRAVLAIGELVELGTTR